jgi:GAF domain-containing protein
MGADHPVASCNDEVVNSTGGLEQFAESARAMSLGNDVAHTLDESVSAAVELVEGCDHATVSIVHARRRISTDAATDDVVRRADELQYETGEGPCLQAMYEHETVLSDDLHSEERWPKWSHRVAEDLGMRSMLCMRLYVGPEDTLGALNLYGDSPVAFRSDDRHTALALAAHTAVALTAAQDHMDLDSALATRTVIGQAQGLLMQRYGLTTVQAFDVLKRYSQAENQKLHVIAADLVRQGQL